MKLALQLYFSPQAAIVSWEQTKEFFSGATSNFQTATQAFKDTSSQAMQNAIAQARTQGFASSAIDWLQAHPVVFRIFNSIIWAIDHPVMGLTVLGLIIATIFSIFKALNRLLEMVGLSLLKAPFKLIKAGLKLAQLGSLGIGQRFITKNDSSSDVIIATPQKSQRLVEISQRLQVLQKEQNDLLQEATNILSFK